MIGLSKICSIALLLSLPLFASAETLETTEPTQNVAVVQDVTQQDVVPEPSAVPPAEVQVAPEVVDQADPQTIQTAPAVDPVTATTSELLEKAKRENAARYSMRRAELSPTECLATAMYHEARGEGTVGMLGVAFVIYNRVMSGKYPSDICKVVMQPSQFSFVSDRNPDNIKDWATYEKILALAVDLVENGGFQRITSPVGAALYFNSFRSIGRWGYAKAMHYVVTIGRQHFFK
jgi:spore germination cell wall hydrolase CwlJ-like protein